MSKRPEQDETSAADGTPAAPADVGSVTVCDVALYYASIGWPVFPLEPGKKTPLGRLARNGVKNATTDPKTIRAWWADTPTANIGIATGAGSGVDVIDFDPDGLDRLADLDPGAGPAVRTPRGAHRYVTHALGRRNSAGKIGAGIDVRGDGGYVVAPPSTVGGRPYSWLPGRGAEEPTVEWNDAKVVPIRAGEKSTEGHGRKGPADDLDTPPIPSGDAYGESAAVAELERLYEAAEGTRNDTLFKCSCNLAELVVGRHLDKDETVEALVSAGRAIGLDDDEITGTVRSAFGRAKPRPRDLAASILADLDADGSSAHEPKRPRPDAPTAPSSPEAAPEGTGAHGGGGGGAEGLDYVCDLLGLPHGSLTRFAREEGEDPSYYLYGPRGAGRLSGKSLSDPRALRAAIKTASGTFVQAPRDKAPWVTVVAALDRAEDVIEGGEEGTAAARGRSVLAEYLHRTAPNSAEDGQYPTELAEWGPWPYLLDDGALVVHSKAVAATVNSRRKGVLAAVDPHDVTRWLRDGLGATRVTVKFKAGEKDTTRSMWRVPASEVPGQPTTPPVAEVPWHVLDRMPRPPYEP